MPSALLGQPSRPASPLNGLMPGEPLSEARARQLMLLILLVGLVVRVALIIVKGHSYHFADTAEYDAMARSMLEEGGSREIPRAPLYPVFMSFVYRISGPSNFPAVRMAQLVFGLAVIWLTGVLGRWIGTPRAGLLAALGVAIAPTLVYTSTMLYPNVLYTAFILACTVLALLMVRRRRSWHAVGFGSFAAAAMLTDQVAVAPIFALLLWSACARNGAPGVGRRICLGIATMALILVATSLLLDRNRAGAPIFFAKAQYVLHEARHDSTAVGGHLVRDGSGSDFHPLSASAFATREMRLAREQPGAYLHDYGYEFLHFFDPSPDRIQTSNVYTGRTARTMVLLYFLPVLILAMIGVAWGIASARDRLLLALVPLSTAALYAFFFTQMRYRIPTEPHFLLLAALGVRRLLSRFPRPHNLPEPSAEQHPAGAAST